MATGGRNPVIDGFIFWIRAGAYDLTAKILSDTPAGDVLHGYRVDELPLPRNAYPHSTIAATTSRPKPCLCALSLSQRPSSGQTESASSNEAMPRHSSLSSLRATKENLFGSGACTLF